MKEQLASAIHSNKRFARNRQTTGARRKPKVAKARIESSTLHEELYAMLRWALIFLVVAIIAAILGFGGIAGASADIAKILFYIFIAIFVISLLVSLVSGRRP